MTALAPIRSALHSTLKTDKKIKLFFWWLASGNTRSYMSDLQQGMTALGLAEILEQHPFLYYMFRAHTYMFKGNAEPQAILADLLKHYKTLANHQSVADLKPYFQSGSVVWQKTIDDLDVKILLKYDHRMRFEGQLSFILYLNNAEAYFINFAFADNGMVKVAGIQGRKENRELYKHFTKVLHGLRPQNFIWMAFLDWCQQFEITQVLGVSSGYHAYQNELKSLEKVSFDYEGFWQEVGGQVHDQVWFELPAQYPHKPIEEVEQKKRSLYRKRYALLEELRQGIQNRNF